MTIIGAPIVPWKHASTSVRGVSPQPPPDRGSGDPVRGFAPLKTDHHNSPVVRPAETPT